jgi:hypothetical protein
METHKILSSRRALSSAPASVRRREEVQMSEEKPNREPEEIRSLTTDIAIVAPPVAILAQPVVGAWANQHFSQDEKPKADPPPPQQQPEKE